MNRLVRYGLLRGIALLLLASPSSADISTRADVQTFIQEVSARRHLDAAELVKLFSQVDSQRKIIDAMDRPAESKPWWQYRKLLLSENHIQGGVEFWQQNRASLEEAVRRYGVAAEMIVGIIGAESRYGQVLGSYRVIDALSTLAFDYPRRSEYFRKELEEYLVLCQEETIIPMQPHGSYAGAMGLPQFMPSSYRQYAADLDGDHKRNIWTNPADAIASVANYFAHSGWRTGEAVAFPARVSGEGFRSLLDHPVQIDSSLAELRSLGVEPLVSVPESTRAKLIVFDGETGPEYWLAAHNFYVITRYNHSPLYAMAAFQLGSEIRVRRGK